MLTPFIVLHATFLQYRSIYVFCYKIKKGDLIRTNFIFSLGPRKTDFNIRIIK